MPIETQTEKPSHIQTTLLRDRSFRGVTLTQFLGAFNDNFYKQLMLLLAIPDAAGMPDQQQVATIVFALPFVLFSGIAGHLSDAPDWFCQLLGNTLSQSPG